MGQFIRHAALALAISAAVGVSGCDAATPPPAKPVPPASTATASVPMKKDGGVYMVPVLVNGLVTFDCIVDSGAADVNIPNNVFQKLVRAGSIQKADYIGTSEYTLADGSTDRGRTYRIKSLKVGNVVVNNVVASIGGDDSSALLGQSFLERFRSWSLDNSRHALVLVGPPSAGHTPPPPAHTPTHPATPPDTTSVAQTTEGQAGRGGHTPPESAAADTDDDRLVSQHSQ